MQEETAAGALPVAIDQHDGFGPANFHQAAQRAVLSLISLGFIVPYEGDEKIPPDQTWYQVPLGEHFR